ncbi:MAG: 3-deoxy-8-phosphooctulonate synthase [Planctomycetota bacterium]|nr:MAG: 3-deoxy-8-phosphooctulonate synthase [Planctomycetota bacterium]
MKPIELDGAILGGGPLFLIAGPCVLEERDLALRIGERAQAVCRELEVPYVFKASFDKANRSSHDAYRGPGLQAGLEILAAVKDALGVPVLTDVHLPEQCAPVAEVVDVLQIPAFLCRQTDLIVAAARTGRAVNIKKGQFLAPWDMKGPLGKARAAGAEHVLLTERGCCFGYNNLVSDLRALPILRGLGAPVVFDATHSLQLPGGRGDRTGGQREFIPHLARAAVAAGVDGVFAEVHEDPSRSPSDAENMLSLDELGPLLQTLVAIHALVP